MSMGGRGGDGDGTRRLFGSRPRPPMPAALARLPAGRHQLPPEFVKENQRSRILAAGLQVFGTRGFVEASVQDLIREAHVSRSTFYGLFPDKEACFLALYDEANAWLWGEAAAVGAEQSDWPHRLRAVTEQVILLLAGDRRLARVCTVEPWSAGDAVFARREQLIGELAGLLRAGRSERPWGSQLPESLEEALLGGAFALLGRYLVQGDDLEPETLATELAAIIAIPYLGAADAQSLVESRER